jgi:hypothetical protein
VRQIVCVHVRDLLQHPGEGLDRRVVHLHVAVALGKSALENGGGGPATSGLRTVGATKSSRVRKEARISASADSQVEANQKAA